MTQQEIEVPVAPATLTFKIERQARTVEGELHVFLDSVSLGKFGSELPASYQQQTFDVSSLAGPGLQTLQFLYRCMKAEETELCPIYNLDDVSLTTGTPDPPAPPPPVLTQPALPVSSPPPAATPPQALKCKKGFRKKTVKGKKRCVRKPRKGKGSK